MLVQIWQILAFNVERTDIENLHRKVPDNRLRVFTNFVQGNQWTNSCGCFCLCLWMYWVLASFCHFCHTMHNNSTLLHQQLDCYWPQTPSRKWKNQKSMFWKAYYPSMLLSNLTSHSHRTDCRQMISAPVIGKLSDYYGRRPLLLLCLAGLFSWAPRLLCAHTT